MSLRVAPGCAVAIDDGEERDGVPAEGAGAWGLGVPEAADAADHGIAEGFGAYVDAVHLEIVEDTVAALLEVADAAGGMGWVPVVADGVVGENVDVSGVAEFVALARVADSIDSGAFHVFGEAEDVGLFAGPGATLPELAIGAAGDEVFVPGGAAAVGVVVVVGERNDGVQGRACLHELHHAVVAADALVDFVDGR